jgi:hypothetical protein
VIVKPNRPAVASANGASMSFKSTPAAVKQVRGTLKVRHSPSAADLKVWVKSSDLPAALPHGASVQRIPRRTFFSGARSTR